MVSGLVTSPWLQLRIFSGEAREIRIESKSAIKFARSYGEDLIFSPKVRLKANQNSVVQDHGMEAVSAATLNNGRPLSQLLTPYLPELRGISSSTQRRGRATATRGSAR